MVTKLSIMHVWNIDLLIHVLFQPFANHFEVLSLLFFFFMSLWVFLE